MNSALTNLRLLTFAHQIDVGSHSNSSQRCNSVMLSSFHASKQLDYRRLPKRPAVR